MRTLHYTWRWDIQAPPEDVWPLVCNTHAFNRAVGLGPWTFDETPNALGGSVRVGFLRSWGRLISWDETPFHWVENREFSVLRVYHSGPFLNVLTRLELEPADSGTTLTYTIDAVPRSRLWGLFARYYIGVRTSRQLRKVFGHVARYLVGGAKEAYPYPVPSLSRGAVARLRDLKSSLVEDGLDGEIARLLADHIQQASDDSCNRLRPYALADLWGEDRETILRLFLHATRAGLLELTWDVMCPLCRGAKDRVESLSALRSRAHCSSCNIQFDANFDQSVEVSFRPSQQIRRLEFADYCVGGPCNTPHVVVQRSIPPGEDAQLTIDLGEGTYRLRGPQITGSTLLEVSPSHPDTHVAEIACSRTDISPQRVELAPGETRLHVRNSEQEELLVILERMRWPEDAVTASQVTALQDFRDLFFSEVLAPEEQFQIRSLTFMFTDLRSSTALYRERGDAPAYVLVRDHFEVISEAVARYHGAVVKTIGDAVMAVFVHLADALDSGLYIHRAFEAQGAEDRGIVVKIGVHEGPCIAVNLNGQLDYFGTNVNTAVRLGSQGLGGDVVVDAGTLEEPTVAEILARPGLHVEHLTVELRGFEEAFDVCRITEGDRGEGEA